jgi:hypothetical protein
LRVALGFERHAILFHRRAIVRGRKRAHGRKRVSIPDANSTVEARRSKQIAIGRIRDAINLGGVNANFMNPLQVCGIPDADNMIVPCGRQRRTVRRNCDATHCDIGNLRG